MKVSLQISSCLWLLLFMHNWCQYHKEHVLGSKSQHLGHKDDGVNRRKGHRREYAPGQRFILTGQHKGKVITHDTHTHTSLRTCLQQTIKAWDKWFILFHKWSERRFVMLFCDVKIDDADDDAKQVYCDFFLLNHAKVRYDSIIVFNV